MNWLLIPRNEEMWEIYEKLSSSTASICLLGLESFNTNCTNGKYENEISYPTHGTNIELDTRQSYPMGKPKSLLGRYIVGSLPYVKSRVGSWRETRDDLKSTAHTAGNLNWINSNFELKVELSISYSALLSPSLIRISSYRDWCKLAS